MSAFSSLCRPAASAEEKRRVSAVSFGHGADLAVTIFRSDANADALNYRQALTAKHCGNSEARAGVLNFRQAMTAKRSCTKVLRAEPTKHYGNSEARLAYAGDLALVSQLTEADTADAVVAQVSVGAAADLAAIVLTSRELRRSLLLENHRFLCHNCTPP